MATIGSAQGPFSSSGLDGTNGSRPFGAADAPVPSPESRYQIEELRSASIGPLLKGAATQFPSSRQRTQGEIINLTLALGTLGNPFSVRRVPFSVLRDMTTDPMIAFALYYTKIPLMRADYVMRCQDAQIAAAVDEAIRKINARVQNQICLKLSYGYQPMCKRFKLGPLRGFYRDPRGEDPERDIPVWDSDIPALLWDDPQVLAPDHCMPRWNDAGEFAGFTYSLVPLPNPAQAGITELYGYQTIPGYTIPPEFAVWPTNEVDESQGSLYGRARTTRAYRYFWSYWYRWALADRIFESSADPVKIVYYPTDVSEAIDPNDPDPANPTALSLQRRALELGAQARQGSTLALPGDFMRDESTGRSTTVRKWEIKYLENTADFTALDHTFSMLDGLKFRAMFLPEEAFVQPGQGARSARNVATQLGELYQESTVLLAAENDDEINKHFIPQFIAANFPDRADTPCFKDSSGFGQKDTEVLKQVLQLVGQVKGEVLPVDIREVLREMGLPLMSEQQQRQQEEQIAKEAAASQPPQTPPQRIGMQGYNSSVEKTPQGLSVYVQGPERIDLSTSNQGFLSDLPDAPAYKDPAVRSSMIKLRKLFLDRYEAQVASFAQHLRGLTTLRLAQQATAQPQTSQSPQQTPAPQGLSAEGAVGVAATVVAGWVAVQAVDGTAGVVKDLLYGVALRAGTSELRRANLHAAVDPVALDAWAKRRSQFVIGSVDKTLQGEMTTFLTDQLQRDTDPESVAEAAGERFSSTPRTHADRVVLAETLPAYNLGALTALRDAGVAQVQASDASGGRDQLTDSKCKEMNGVVMTVEQALVASQDEHPAGTLFWTPLSTDDLQVLVVSALPGSIDSTLLAHYDADHERLYVLEAATDDQRCEFALAVGRSLILT